MPTAADPRGARLTSSPQAPVGRAIDKATEVYDPATVPNGTVSAVDEVVRIPNITTREPMADDQKLLVDGLLSGPNSPTPWGVLFRALLTGTLRATPGGDFLVPATVPGGTDDVGMVSMKPFVDGINALAARVNTLETQSGYGSVQEAIVLGPTVTQGLTARVIRETAIVIGADLFDAVLGPA